MICDLAIVIFFIVPSCSEMISKPAFLGYHMNSCYLEWVDFATWSEKLCSWVLTYWCPSQRFMIVSMLAMWTWSLLNKEIKVSHQTCEVPCGWTQIISQSSVYIASFPHCFAVANKFLPSIYLLFCFLFQYQLLKSLGHSTSKCQQLLTLPIYLCFLISPSHLYLSEVSPGG